MAHPTVNDIERVSKFTVVASQDTFNLTFPIFQKDGTTGDASLDVYVDGVLKPTAEWSFSGTFTNGVADGGDVVFATAITSGTVVIVGNMPAQRTSDYSAGGFNTDSFNTDLDRFAAMIREVQLVAKRSIKIPAHEDDAGASPHDYLLPTARANKVLAFDANGRPVVSTTDLSDIESAVTTPAAATVFDVRSYGATGDGVTNDTTAFTDAVSALNTAGGGRLYIPKGTYIISGGTNLAITVPCIVFGDGPDATVIDVQAPSDGLHTSDADFLVLSGDHAAVRDLTVLGNKEDYNSGQSWPNGVGESAIRATGSGTFVCRNCRVEQWAGTAFRVRPASGNTLVGWVESCTAFDCGRPSHSPGIEHGDGFQASELKWAAFVNCHYVDPADGGGGGNERMTRGGFVCTDDKAEHFIVRDCSSVSAHRAIHLEPVPNRTTIEGFRGEDARNGMIAFDSATGGANDVTIVIRNSYFNDCGEASNGCFHTGSADNITLIVEDTVVEDVPTGNLYRHHSGNAPTSVRFRGVRNIGTTGSFQSQTTSEISYVLLENCDIGELQWDKIGQIYADNCEIDFIAGANGGAATPPRQMRFRNCIIGRGQTDQDLVNGEPYCGLLVFDGCTFEYDSTDGTHHIMTLSDTSQVYVLNSAYRIVTTNPTAAFEALFNTDITVYGEISRNWTEANIFTSNTGGSGVVRFGPQFDELAVVSKLGVFGKAPIAQPSGANQAALTNNTAGTQDGTLATCGDTSTADQSGVINDNFTDIHTLLDEIRTALVNVGIIKGSA